MSKINTDRLYQVDIRDYEKKRAIKDGTYVNTPISKMGFSKSSKEGINSKLEDIDNIKEGLLKVIEPYRNLDVIKLKRCSSEVFNKVQLYITNLDPRLKGNYDIRVGIDNKRFYISINHRNSKTPSFYAEEKF